MDQIQSEKLAIVTALAALLELVVWLPWSNAPSVYVTHALRVAEVPLIVAMADLLHRVLHTRARNVRP